MRERLGSPAFLAVLSAFLIAALSTAAVAWDLPPVWDSGVYLAMGKNLFSLGEFGFWEIYRPPAMPVLLGVLWKLGLPVEGLRMVAVSISALSAAAIYLVFSEFRSERAGLVAAGAVLGSYVFLKFSVNPLTGIPASALVVLSLYLYLQERPAAAGAAAGMAFLTRFPSALVLFPIAGWIAYGLARGKNGFRGALKEGLALGAGFAVLVLPYLAIVQVVYGDFTAPFTTGFTVTAETGTSYLYGLYYLSSAVRSNPLMLLAPLGVYFGARSGEVVDRLLLAALAVFYGFFTYFPLKIDRYILLFLPLLAYFTGRAAEGVLSRLEKPGMVRGRFDYLLAAVLILPIAFSGMVVFGEFDWSNPDQQSFLDEVSGLEGTVASNDPRTAVYGNFEYRAVPVRELDSVWERRDEVDWWAIDTCSWDCRNGGPNCEQDIQSFEEKLQQFEKSFETSGGECSYTVWRSR